MRPLMQRIRDLSATFQARAIGAQPDYEREIAKPEVWNIWKERSQAAAPTYNAAMQEVITHNIWASAIQRTDPRTYGEMVRAKAARRVQGIQLGANRWMENISPIFEALDRVIPTLPPRGPKMSSENINRFMTVIRTIHEAARARRGVGAAGTPIGVAGGSVHYPSPESLGAGTTEQVGGYTTRAGY